MLACAGFSPSCPSSLSQFPLEEPLPCYFIPDHHPSLLTWALFSSYSTLSLREISLTPMPSFIISMTKAPKSVSTAQIFLLRFTSTRPTVLQAGPAPYTQHVQNWPHLPPHTKSVPLTLFLALEDGVSSPMLPKQERHLPFSMPKGQRSLRSSCVPGPLPLTPGQPVIISRLNYCNSCLKGFLVDVLTSF